MFQTAKTRLPGRFGNCGGAISRRRHEMALERISGVLAQMRENTAKLSEEARLKMARETAERIAAFRPRFALTRLGGARGGMKKERCLK